MNDESSQLRRVRECGVVPVVTIPRTELAVPLARALYQGGLEVIEVTLRTPCALDAISAIANADVRCLVGAGTILSSGDVSAAAAAGADFLVTPGTPQSLVPALLDFHGLAMPGVSTATEALTLFEHGFAVQKFFPAGAAGGAGTLKALAAPLPAIGFVPTGGVNTGNLSDYLSLPNVAAVGGSWLAPKQLVEAGDWAAITRRANEAREIVAACRG